MLYMPVVSRSYVVRVWLTEGSEKVKIHPMRTRVLSAALLVHACDQIDAYM